MLKPGDVVTFDFAGATGNKRRPAIVVSSDLYHAHRPDLILAVLTTQVQSATAPTDYVLQTGRPGCIRHRHSAPILAWRFHPQFAKSATSPIVIGKQFKIVSH